MHENKQFAKATSMHQWQNSSNVLKPHKFEFVLKFQRIYRTFEIWKSQKFSLKLKIITTGLSNINLYCLETTCFNVSSHDINNNLRLVYEIWKTMKPLYVSI